MDHVAAEGYVAFVDDDVAFRTAVIDGETFIVDDRVAHGDAAFFRQVDVLVQLNHQLCAAVFRRFGYYADVAVGKFVFAGCGGVAYDIYIIVQFYRYRIVLGVAEVTAVLHAVVQGGYFVFGAVVVFVDDAVHAVFAVCAVGAVNAYRAFLHGDIGFGVLSVLAGLAGEADVAFGAVFAVLDTKNVGSHICILN